MILPTLISNQPTPAKSLAGAHPRSEDTPASQAAPDHTSCRLQINRVVNEIESPQVREIVGAVFKDLLRLLECLGLIESHLRQVDAATETFALFQLIHDEARILVEFIREDGLNCLGLDEELADTLDGITFAVNHDLQRVFEAAPHATNSETLPSSPHVVLGKLYRAHDVLTNCLQQSTITLAMMFNPELVGARLFNNSDMRYRQSLQLCEDLSALIRLLETAEKPELLGGSPASGGVDTTFESNLARLMAGIEKFRGESMECLMYSDWPQFESFCERIKVGPPSATALESVLHQFRCYLETLLGQVRMRAVLANVFPVQFGAGEPTHLTPGGDENSMQFSAPLDFPEEDFTWNRLALAG
jgi:hypothetical protein